MSLTLALPTPFFIPSLSRSRSQEYPYGEKEIKQEIPVAGIPLPVPINKQIATYVAILALLAPAPLFVGLVALGTPGFKSPFQFLDRWYPPAVANNPKAQEAAAKKKAAEAAKKAEEAKKAEAKKAEEAKAKAAAAAKAKDAAEAKAKAAAEAKAAAAAKKEAEKKAAAKQAEAEAKAKAEAEARAKAAAEKKAAEAEAKAAAEAARPSRPRLTRGRRRSRTRRRRASVRSTSSRRLPPRAGRREEQGDPRGEPRQVADEGGQAVDKGAGEGGEGGGGAQVESVCA